MVGWDHARVLAAELELIWAAECCVWSYEARSGYTAPLSENLRRLSKAVRVWRAEIEVAGLNSDVNGYDRSGGYNCEQTIERVRGEVAAEQRRRETTATVERAAGDTAQTAEAAQPQRARTA